MSQDQDAHGIFHPTKILVTTGLDLPGWEITEVLGPVFGVVVRSRNIGANLGAAAKSFIGGELKALTKNVELSRELTMDRMVGAAMAQGAQGVIAFRFDASGAEGTAEVCCYGTAVKARRLVPNQQTQVGENR